MHTHRSQIAAPRPASHRTLARKHSAQALVPSIELLVRCILMLNDLRYQMLGGFLKL